METERTPVDEQARLLPTSSSYDSTSTNVLITDTRRSLSCWSTSVEVVVVIIYFSKILSDTLIANFLEYTTCKVVYNYNDTMCTDPVPIAVEDLVQPIVANIMMMRSFAESLVPSFFVLFAGPWSDSNGRKPFLMVSIAGLSISYALWGLISVFPQLRPEYYLLASIPVVFTGGTCTVFMALYCYLCDVTTMEDRALRMAMLHFVYNIGNFFGAMSAPQIFKTIPNFPYTTIFMISSGVLMVGVIYVAVCITESIVLQVDRQRSLIQVDHIQKLFAVCFMKRPQHARTMILLIAGSLGIVTFMQQGESNVIYLSLREMFGWQLESYSFFASCTLIFNSLGGFLGVWLFITLLNFPVMPMAIAVAFCRTAQAAINAMASDGFYFYIASGIGGLIYMIGTLCRLEVSKLMPQQDIGKIMAFIAFLESICPIVAAPLYTFLYDATYNTHPEAIFWLSTCLSFLPVGFLLAVVILQYFQENFAYTGLEPAEVHV